MDPYVLSLYHFAIQKRQKKPERIRIKEWKRPDERDTITNIVQINAIFDIYFLS